ncbi:C40 family peptidase [Streptomyces griseosporeus]|uniref:C40 family peptidase n=1 Tax=Streptomyces griseosporeus TaxID=1910 RepID=UPI0036FC9E4C
MAPERNTIPTTGPARASDPFRAPAVRSRPAPAGDTTPLAGDDGPGREEVRRRIAALYDLAENDTGTFNATRAQAARGRRPADDARGRAESPLGAVTRQWFDVARAKLGPTMPAVLPGRVPGRAETPSPAGRTAPDGPSRALPPASGAPARALPAASGAPSPALPAAPVAPALPEGRPASGRQEPGSVQQPQSVSPAAAKQRTQAQLAACRALLAGLNAAADTGQTLLSDSSVLPLDAGVLEVGTGLSADLAGIAADTGQHTFDTGQFALPAYAPAPAMELAPAMEPSLATEFAPDGKAAPAVAFARAQTGKPCVWGATGPGSYDGPSLVRAAWRAAGVVLPRTAQDQALAGTPVPPAAARPGDLVFFQDAADHVGLCTGAGTVVHAPGPGAYIREEPLAEAGPVDGVVRPS